MDAPKAADFFMEKLDQIVTVQALRRSRSLHELREWVDAVQRLLHSTKENRARARLPKGALKNFCEEVVPALVCLEHEFANTTVRVVFPAGGADDAVVTTDDTPRREISLQVVSGFRNAEFAHRMEMLSARGHAPGFGSILKTLDRKAKVARYDVELLAIRREKRVAAAVVLMEARLLKKARLGYSHALWLIVDADAAHFEQGDMDTLFSRATSAVSTSPFERVYIVNTSSPRACRRIH